MRVITMNSAPVSEYKTEFCQRTRERRLAAGYTKIVDFAEKMGTSKENWTKYETRTPLPHHMIERFCALTETSITYLFTGRGPKVDMPYNHEALLRTIQGALMACQQLGTELDAAELAEDVVAFYEAIARNSHDMNTDQVATSLAFAYQRKTRSQP